MESPHTSSCSCMIKENLSKKRQNNTTMKKRTSSLPTAISQANARTAIRKELTATNAKSAELPFHRQTLSIRRAPSVAANR